MGSLRAFEACFERHHLDSKRKANQDIVAIFIIDEDAVGFAF